MKNKHQTSHLDPNHPDRHQVRRKTDKKSHPTCKEKNPSGSIQILQTLMLFTPWATWIGRKYFFAIARFSFLCKVAVMRFWSELLATSVSKKNSHPNCY